MAYKKSAKTACLSIRFSFLAYNFNLVSKTVISLNKNANSY